MFFILLGILFVTLPLIVLGVVIVAAIRERQGSAWRFDIGRVFSNSFAAIGGAPLAFIGVSLLANGLPGPVIASIMNHDIRNPMSLENWAQLPAFVAVSAIAWLVLGTFLQLALIRLALDALNGRKADAVRAMRGAVRILPVGIAVSILMWIGIGLGLMLLVVPGIIAMLTWFVVMPVLVHERRSVFDTFSRSGELTRGFRWRLLLLLMLAAIAAMLATSLVGALVIAGGVARGAFGTVVQTIANTLLGTIPPAGLAAVYHEMRTEKEGTGSQDLAQVFA